MINLDSASSSRAASDTTAMCKESMPGLVSDAAYQQFEGLCISCVLRGLGARAAGMVSQDHVVQTSAGRRLWQAPQLAAWCVECLFSLLIQ
jgi:hypothetical protein